MIIVLDSVQASANLVTTDIVETPFGAVADGQYVEYDDDTFVYYDDNAHVEHELA